MGNNYFEFYKADVRPEADFKIRKLIDKHGSAAYAVWYLIVPMLYRSETGFLVENETTFDEIGFFLKLDLSEVKTIVDAMVAIGLLSRAIDDPRAIGEVVITNARVQKAFNEADVSRNRVSEIRRAAVNKRWGAMQTDASACTSIQTDTKVYKPIQTDTKHTKIEKENKKENKKESEILARAREDTHTPAEFNPSKPKPRQEPKPEPKPEADQPKNLVTADPPADDEFLKIALDALQPTGQNSEFENTSAFINCGRRPMTKYPDLWFTPIELSRIVKDWVAVGIEGELKTQCVRMQTKMESMKLQGKDPANIGAANWFMGFVRNDAAASKLVFQKIENLAQQKSMNGAYRK